MKTLAGPDGEPLPVDWVKSDSIVEATVCTLSGQAPMAGVPTRKDLFVRGAVPTRRCGDLTTEQRAEVQSALDTLRLYPNRFFDDGRARLTQLANISRTRATTPTRGPAVSTPPRSAPDLLATPTPADEQETPDIEGAEPTAAPTPRVVERQQETPVADAQAGGNLVMAPNIIGLPEGEAQSQIRAAGLATAPPVYQTQADMPPGVDITSVPVGAVISASPLPGARIERGTVVTIAVRKE
jgi:hypothetical protein